MAIALPLTHSPVALPKTVSSNVPGIDLASANTPDPSLLHTAGSVNHHTPDHTPVVSPETEAFYTMGPDAVPAGPKQIDPSSSIIDSAKLFEDPAYLLQSWGGPSNPMAMLKFQFEIARATDAWQATSQVAGKLTSGLNTLMTNQV